MCHQYGCRAIQLVAETISEAPGEENKRAPPVDCWSLLSACVRPTVIRTLLGGISPAVPPAHDRPCADSYPPRRVVGSLSAAASGRPYASRRLGVSRRPGGAARVRWHLTPGLILYGCVDPGQACPILRAGQVEDKGVAIDHTDDLSGGVMSAGRVAGWRR